jgi:hypothetical protein
MATITPDYQIASGHNQAGSLTRWDAINDANGVRFIMPRGLPSRTRGELRFRTDGSAARVGSDGQTWLFTALTLAQYSTLITTYEGLVTVRTALTSVTFANYNASLIVPDEAELEYGYLIGSGYDTGFTGPGYKNVECRLLKLEAL